MARKINQEGIAKIKQWEGLRTRAYKDSGGVLTIGYGHTSAAGAPEVKAGMTITEAEAEQILRRDLAIFEKRVSNLVKVGLTDNQFAALVSFDFNTGALHKSTLLKKLNAGDYDAVPSEMLRWVHAGGKKVEGLANRRAAEAGLWAKGAPVASNTVPASAAGAPIITKENVTFGAGILASLASLFDGTGPVQYALAAVIAASFIGGGFFILRDRFWRA